MSAQDRRAVADRALRLFPALHAGAQIHLLANTLSTAGALMRRRPDVAEDLLAQFVTYLRELLGTTRPLVPLTEELRLVFALIGVERARMGGRLRLEVACTAESRDAFVPPLVLQPLVENAIRHGIARRPMGGRVRILGRVAGATLHLAVVDDGPGLRRAQAAGSGTGWGLSSVRLRLAALCGPTARLRLLGRPDRGTLAAISLPALLAPGRRFGTGP